MNYILIDDHTWRNPLPLTYTRPVSEIRTGILTIKEKWDRYLDTDCSYITEAYLAEKYTIRKDQTNILINSSILPNKELAEEISKLELGKALIRSNIFIAVHLRENQITDNSIFNLTEFQVKSTDIDFRKIEYSWDIFKLNGEEITSDFALLTNGRKSAPLPKSIQTISPENIFFEEGAKAAFASINASAGPVYIGKEAEIMEGSLIRGPFALCEHSATKLGAKIYGPTTIGPHSKVGGELNNCVIFGYSNKAHDGFLGNSVLGEWCNIGADTNNSNLKNNYAEVRLWNYNKEGFIKTGLQFCGLIMGDHSKCGINTMFNTGTVIGVNSNIFGSGFPRNFIPSFSWGGAHGFSTYGIQKAFEVAALVMSRRNKVLDEKEKAILNTIFELSAKYRKF
ncbi:MAG: glucose-1-phosphate thymidylyltransferase [Marinilabiliales bacterium]|nr:MAG: glucose-1-phosphate thymidylyltransferase [Marinilabiliales bacterium]